MSAQPKPTVALPANLVQHLRSQPHVGQDRWLYENMFGPGCPFEPKDEHGNPTPGFFFDVGAYGEEGSNSWLFEKALGWKGILIEPNPKQAAELRSKRSSPVVECAIDAQPGERPFLQIVGPNQQLSGLLHNYDPRWKAMLENQHRIHKNEQNVLQVPCRRLQDIFDEHGITRVDYLSIDTEGSEMQVLNSIDWDRMDIRVITVEDAHSDLPAPAFMETKGYKVVHKKWPDIFFAKK